MDTMTRRRFLIASGVVARRRARRRRRRYTLRDILATAEPDRAGPATDAGAASRCTAATTGSTPSSRTPTRPTATARPGLAYDAGDQVLRLDDAHWAQPGAEGPAQAVRRRSGSRSSAASATRSRTAATSARWTSGRPASPERPGTTGWLGRWLDTAGGDPRLAVSFEPVLPPLLAGATQRRRGGAAAVPSAARRVTPDGCCTAPRAGRRGEPALQARAAALLRRPGPGRPDDRRRATEADEDDRRATATTPATAHRRRRGRRWTPSSAWSPQCVEAGVATRVYSVSLGGFDLHADEKRRAGDAAAPSSTGRCGVRLDRMAGRTGPAWWSCVYSEFGRRVRANASDGTDHGTASNVFLLAAPGARRPAHRRASRASPTSTTAT